jgi:arylsulfatase A-like enzyme
MQNTLYATIYFVIIATLTACGGPSRLPTTKPIITARPNILFIYTDDQSDRTVSCYEHAFDWVRTPNIDGLAAQGARFTQAHIGSWCMASRAAILTGLQQHAVESMRMAGPYPGSTYDPDKCKFWPAVFRQQGYQTAHIGKWHTGVDAGFGRDWDFQKVWNRPAHPENAPNYYDNQLISTNGQKPVMTKGYSTDNYTKWATEYIKGTNRDAKKPWMLWLCYGAVHGPFTPAKRHLNNYKNVKVPTPKDVYPPRPTKPKYVQTMEFWRPSKLTKAGKPAPDSIPLERAARKAIGRPMAMKDIPGKPLKDWVRQYHQGVLAIDEGVGKLLVALKESGQHDNTIVIFTSDQGFAWGQHGFKTKVAPYHATVAAPMIVRVPDHWRNRDARSFPKGAVIKHPVSGVDITPSIFAWAGIKQPWFMHGNDITPLLKNPKAQWDHPSLLVHTGKQYGSDTNTVPAADNPKLIHGPGIPWYVMLAQGKYKYIRTLIKGEIEELYDSEKDPDELTNLALDPAHKKRLLTMRADAVLELSRTDAKMVNNLPAVGTKPHTIKNK